jgi:PTH1 family peptidyl-tRNA hydrolase
MIRLIVGLGNIGKEYERTRHNAGFMAVDFLAGDDAVWKKHKNYLAARIDDAVFVKPTTFMNLSGAAVLAAMKFYKIPIEDVVVIHDEIDLPLGTLRTKVGGGSAGHNGIKSIDGAIGNEYRRIRIGIGRPVPGQARNDKIFSPDVPDWVLGRFSGDELTAVNGTFGRIAEII